MAKLNFYDTEAVKAFILNILVENRELKDDLEAERSQSNYWFGRYQETDRKIKDLEAKAATMEGGSNNE